MPHAFKNAGLVVGSVGTLFIGLICCHVIHVLVSYFLLVSVYPWILKYFQTVIMFFSLQLPHGYFCTRGTLQTYLKRTQRTPRVHEVLFHVLELTTPSRVANGEATN